MLELDLGPAAPLGRGDRHRALRRTRRTPGRGDHREPVNLIEALADRLLAVCWPSRWWAAATVTVHKPGPPDPARLPDVAVTMRRTR
ncbi:hypothetical protein [Micromonospora sp. b486]|uniref:dihydroneopterin aldolase n=1 Tax=Micromonospora sp. b486 TaxID=3053986 RepID=UPI00259CB40C|nr:hypothetical protein [Micromonospora sp. b486]MDM4784603.1 hypothetical protein [Micromonospora sp. b486]